MHCINCFHCMLVPPNNQPIIMNDEISVRISFNDKQQYLNYRSNCNLVIICSFCSYKDVETESHERGSRRKTRSDVKEDQV